MAVSEHLPGRLLGRPWLLVFSLLLLHLALVQGVASPIARGLLIGHLGSVLMWQPLLRGDRRVSLPELAVCLLLGLVLGTRASWGLMLYWALFLAAMLGGRLFVLTSARARLPVWLALVYLVFALVGLILPETLPPGIRPPALLEHFVAWLTPALFALMLVLGTPEEARREEPAVDVVGSLLMVLVLGGVMMGALALMFVGGRDYLQALLQATLVTAAGLMLLGWVWNPRAGFGGLGLAVARYVLSGGRYFERWLDEVAQLAVRDDDVERFVADAAERMLRWPEVVGVGWLIRSGGQTGCFGRCQGTPACIEHGQLRIELYGGREFNPSLLWQADLMIRLLAQFHAARMQAQRLRAMSYVHAVHETGARMTHEVKNLLQSLDTLCFAVADASPERAAELQGLLARQLPAISRRLHEALEKIRRPEAEAEQPMPVEQWWSALQERFVADEIEFSAASLPTGCRVPAVLFDTVADNLLRNALEKRASMHAGHLRIRVRLEGDAAGGVLSVEDDGAPMTTGLRAQLFSQPLASASGLGIGLYQSARLAEAAGYALALACNEPGCVRFILGPQQMSLPH